MSIIEDIVGREILDSRGNPTVEVEVVLDSGATGPGRRSRRVPPPAPFEAVELRDGARPLRRQGRARPPSTHVNGEIADALVGFDALDQRDIDRRALELDGTDNKARLGANAILGVSLAVGQGRRRRAGPARSTATSVAPTPTCCPCR